MQIGFCARIDRAEEIAAAGYDYIEMPVTAAAAWTEEEFESNLKKLRALGLPSPVFNVLFPGEIRLLDPVTQDEEITGYLDHALARVKALGAETVVFGSGRSRMRPEDVPYDAAFRRLVEVTRLIGECAKKQDITIVIEPLNRGETNMINSVAEGACLRAAVNHPNVQLLADYYHIAVEGHDPADLERLGGISHCHIATLEGRKAPTETGPGFTKLFTAMKKTGYQGRISVEGKCDDLKKDGPTTVALLKRLWEEA